MSAAATRPTLAEHHVAEFNGLQVIRRDRVVHPGAGNALAEEDEQMRAAERIVFHAVAVKHGVRHHRIGELDRHAREHLVEHGLNARDVAGNDGIA